MFGVCCRCDGVPVPGLVPHLTTPHACVERWCRCLVFVVDVTGYQCQDWSHALPRHTRVLRGGVGVWCLL